MSFEKKMVRLEEITDLLENDKTLTIDKSLKLYNEAIELSKALVTVLDETKGKLKVLNESLEELDVKN